MTLVNSHPDVYRCKPHAAVEHLVVETEGKTSLFYGDSALSTGGDLQDALTFGCRIAGGKCGFHGYDGISEMLQNV